jgi:hypothetical protein
VFLGGTDAEAQRLGHDGAARCRHKQGSRLVRWAVIEGTVRYHGGGKLAADYRHIAQRRGKNKATMAIARKVLTLVYYGLRDGEIRCLAHAA